MFPAMQNPQIAVYTSAHLIRGEVAAGRTRLSDLVNDTSTSYLEIHGATWHGLQSEGEADGSAARLTVRKEEIHLAIPMDVSSVTAARTSTQQVPLDLCIGMYVIRGALHRRPGDPTNLISLLTGFSREFVPVSEAEIQYAPNPRIDTAAPVVLINTRRLHFWAQRS